MDKELLRKLRQIPHGHIDGDTKIVDLPKNRVFKKLLIERWKLDEVQTIEIHELIARVSQKTEFEGIDMSNLRKRLGASQDIGLEMENIRALIIMFNGEKSVLDFDRKRLIKVD
jgi:hypothetical protein